MPHRRFASSYLLVGGLTVTLVILAALQYRWSAQISEAERARIKSNLQIAGSQFRNDFARDLLALSAAFQVDASTIEKRDWDRLARQSADWLRSAPDAGMIAGVYLWQPGPDSFSVLNRTTQHFENASPPPALRTAVSQWREQLLDNRPGRPFRMMTWTLDTGSPALVRSLFEFGESGQRGRPRLAGEIVITLNRQFLQERFFPDLAARHFDAPGGFLYNVAVIPGEDGAHAIYRSDGFHDADSASADLNIPLLEGRSRGGPGGPPFGGGIGMGLGPGAGDRRRFGSRFPAAPLLLTAEGSEPWRLVARHRAGSVDVAVAQAQWRDLAVSFAILLLLGASMALIVVSTQRAQRLARLQMEFVAGISHELRTPLTVISSAAQNLSDGIVDGKPQVKLYGTLIRNESRRLTGMMEQILQFAAGQKKRDYEPQPIAPAELVENALALAANLIEEGGVTVEREIAPALPVVMGESGALTQCLHNLIANAVKYGGQAKWLGIRAWVQEEEVRIAVADQGIGIEPGDLPHVFEAFYRSRAVTAAQIHGTGLGLSLARNFAREAGGAISVESTPGRGSCFTLQLPAARTAVPELAERTV